MDTSSPKANLGSVDKLVGMIGHSIFLDLTSEFQRQKKSNRDNFDQFLTVPDDLGCPQNFLSMGLAAIHFPKDKVLHACSSRLARQIVARWTEPLQKTANVGSFTEGEMGRLGLDPDEVKRQITVANQESGELLRDRALAHWTATNGQYQTAYPGNNRVVEMLTAKQKEQEVKVADNDPNPDLLGKRRQNMGEYLFQIQENLRALVPAKERALRGFISACVNDPNRRHGVARAFLDQATERFRAYADNLGKERDAHKETLGPVAEQRDAQLGGINNAAGDFALGLVLGAKRNAIDEKKDAYLVQARRWDVAVLDMRSAEAAVYFYTQMLTVLERLKEEMDAYIERMKGLEAFFRKEEQTAIENPVDVNGLIIFDRGRRVDNDNGTATYVDGDIDHRYSAYVGDGADPGNPAVSSAAADSLTALGSTGDIYGIRDQDLNRVKAVLFGRARDVFKPVENEAVVDKFFEKFGSGSDRSIEELRRVFALSQPFIHLQENAPNYKHTQNKEQTIVGQMHGSEGRTEQEARFLTMLRDTVQGIRDGQISNANEQHQVLFLRERAAFPLRLLEGMDSYKFAYEQARAQGAAANPIHTRRDVKEWIRINPPSFEDQKQAWQAFCVGWSTGVITEKRDTRYTATGAKETIQFEASYRDRFGLPKTDPLGTFVSITGDMAKLMRAAETDQESENRPPREAREIVLILCDNPTLREQLEQGIEGKLHEMGVTELGNHLVAHARTQERALPAAIYRPYQKAISDYLEQINYAGPGAPVAVTPVAAPAPPVATATPTNGASQTNGAAATTATIAPLAAAPNQRTVRERLVELKGYLEDGLIDQADFDARKATILADL